MVDVFDAKKRSEVMSRIRGKGNKSTEIALASAFRKIGVSGWRRHIVIRLKLQSKRGTAQNEASAALVVRPDFVFKHERLIVFVDGCFWHQCPLHSKIPANNREFWEQKLGRNMHRDQLTNRGLKKLGWKVIRIWEHDLTSNADTAAAKVRRFQKAAIKRRCSPPSAHSSQ